MTRIFDKLNLKDQTEILVLNPPQSFEPELAALTGITVVREVNQARKMDFVLAFVTQQEQVDTISKIIAAKAEGDAMVWFVYPKGTSKKYKSSINRDSGWEIMGKAGFERVRLVAIDEDWSALRFRRVEFIKTMERRESFAQTKDGKAKTKK
jgi:hypothetical protein